MRVLMVADSRVVHARRPLQWLVREGVDVLLLDTAATPTDIATDGSFRRDQFPAEVRSYWLTQMTRRIGPWSQSLMETGLDPLTWRHLRKLHDRFRPQLVHVHWIDRPAYHCAKAGLAPLVLSAWGSDINRLFPVDQGDAALNRLRRKTSYALRNCDHLVTDAPDLVKRCEQLAGRQLSHSLLPLGIATARFTRDLSAERLRWRRQLDLPERAFVFGSFREMRPLYGHHLILEAFALAVANLPPDAFLLFKPYYSEGTPREPDYEPTIKARADELGVANRLRWVHDVAADLLPELYATVDALVNYPVMDGFPVHFLETAAAGKPMISCRQPAYEWGFSQAAFRFVDRGDAAALAAAMCDVWREADTAAASRRLSDARNSVVERYDERAAARGLLEIYRQRVR